MGQKRRRRGDDADDNGHGDSVRPEQDGRREREGGPPSERARPEAGMKSLRLPSDGRTDARARGRAGAIAEA